MDCKLLPATLRGTVQVPASKSIAHRALLCAALADGESVLTNVTPSQDIDATCGVLEALGAKIVRQGTTVTVQGIREVPQTPLQLDCRESGSTLRFLLPVAAALGVNATLTGTGRLPYRPLTAYLREFSPEKGIQLMRVGDPDAVLPLQLQGKLQSGLYLLEGDVSSQFLTGLLYALPLTAGESEVRLTSRLESRPYVELTLDALRHAGIRIVETPTGYQIPGGQTFRPYNAEIEGDYSQAAFFLTANAIGNPVTVSNLSDKSLQGDRKIVEILEKLCYTKKDGIRNGFTVDASDIPDLVPILAVLGCFCGTPSRIFGAKRLRLKESDRLTATTTALRAIGGDLAETEDGLEIRPVESFTGGTAEGFGDHRIVMSLAIAATRARQPVIIRGADAVNKSYPAFFTDYNSIGGKMHVISLE